MNPHDIVAFKVCYWLHVAPNGEEQRFTTRPLTSLRCEYGLSVKPNIAQHSISTGALSNRVVSAGDNMNGSKTAFLIL